MIALFITISIIYFGLIIAFIVGFNKVKTFNTTGNYTQTSFSIIIPFRNEEENLETLLNSIYNLDYPQEFFEVLLVNDGSTDSSEAIISTFIKNHSTLNLKILQNEKKSNSPKKDAITKAIKHAKFNWLITTDADCIVPKLWLKTLTSFITQKDPYFISGPVTFIQEKSFLFEFQKLNLLSLTASTIGAFGLGKPFLCNGANLCYRKDIFLELNGFENNTNIASGDDIFLLEKFVEKHPKRTHYLKNTKSIVQTKSQENTRSFINQQLRWASKSSAYKNWFSKFVGVTVFFMNLLILLTALYCIITTNHFEILGITLFFKYILDLYLIQKNANFLNIKFTFHNFTIASFSYPFFIIYIALLTKLKKFTWKGREFSK